MANGDCLFCRIAAGELPAKKVLEDDSVVAFHDIDPQAPTHVLVIPRRHIASAGALEAGDAELMGRLVRAAAEVAEREGVAESGYRLVINNGGDALQSVDHIHVHVLGGRRLGWPPG